jgi:cohesin loading factor subunit SCC2
VTRISDEDDKIKDQALKTIEELWFRTPVVAPSSRGHKSNDANPSSTERSRLLARVTVIMGVCTNLKDRQKQLEDTLSKIMSSKEGADAAKLHERYTEICGTLIDNLVDDSDIPGFVSLLSFS